MLKLLSMQLTPAVLGVAACAAVLGLSSGCGKHSAGDGASRSAEKQDWVKSADATPGERTYLTYTRSIIEAVANREYDRFYDELSTHARARMSLNQFAPEDDGAAFDKHEKQPKLNVSAPEFVKLMARTEELLGQPQAPLNLYVHSTDPKALSGGKAQGIDAIDAMFAIGNMPASIPAAVRKASLRAKIGVQLSAAEFAATAKAQNVTVEELQKDPDFHPYLTLKLVLVQEADQLRIGYFEFLPPSMMD